MAELWHLGAGALSRKIASGAVSPVEVMRACLGRIEAVNNAVNAIVSLRDTDLLMAEARAAEQQAARGWLHGIPVAVKDLVAVAGVRSTWGSDLLRDHVPDVDDGLARRLRAAGAIVIGKTNVPEFGFGSHSTNPVFGVTRNPFDLGLSAGGSSGGAGAALATGMLSVADGSDMMGSLRNPAAWNDVWGFRPSVGVVPGEPRDAVLLHRLSTHGPMAREVADLAAMLGTLSDRAVTAAPGVREAPLRIGWLGDWGGAYGMAPGLMAACEGALSRMAGLGWRVDPVAPPVPAPMLWDSWTTLRSFAVAMELGIYWRDPSARARLGPNAQWEVARGLALSADQVERAVGQRRAWLDALAALFAEYDALLLPSTQLWPFPADWDWPRDVAGAPADTYHRWMEVVIPASLAGIPALAMPGGLGDNGLPFGLQMLGPAGGDAGLLAAGLAWEAEIGPRVVRDPV